MSEIRFTTERMHEVWGRLDEMIEITKTSSASTNEYLNSITANIESEDIKKIIDSYVKVVEAEAKKAEAVLNQLRAYLYTKIKNYTQLDVEGAESINEIEALLKQLD